MLAFTLFTSASVAEIVRGGLASVPHGQYEAAKSQGFSAVQTYVVIILPQALRNMVPALLSQFVTTIKDTSYLWGAMALQELMGRGMILMNSYNSTTQIFAIFGIMALIYFVVCFTLSQIVRAYQRRLKEASAAGAPAPVVLSGAPRARCRRATCGDGCEASRSTSLGRAWTKTPVFFILFCGY